MNEIRLISDSHTVSFDCTLPGNADWVWWHLTDPAGLRAWLADAQMESRIGGSVRLRFQDDEALAQSSSGVRVQGVISCYEPCRRLAYSWLEASRENGPFIGRAAGSSRVTFNLVRGQGRTLLSLTHAGLPADILSRISAGWHAHLGLLANVLSEDEDGRPAVQQTSFVPRGTYVESFVPGMRA